MNAGQRAVAVLAAAAMLVAGVFHLPAASSAEDSGPTRIMIVGDSITHGSSGDYTWRYRLARHLEATGEQFDFVGPDRGLLNLHEDAPSYDYVDPAFDQDHAAVWGAAASMPPQPVGELVDTYQPDVVVGLIGVNDLVWLGLTPADLEEVMRAWVAAVRAAKPDVAIVLGRLTATNFAGVSEYNERLSAMVASLTDPASPVVVADSDAGFAESQDTWDPAHPNALGELKIAAAMADALAVLAVGAPYPRPLPQVPLGPRFAPALSGAAGDESATLTWGVAPGALSEHVWWRDVTAGGPWARTAEPVEGEAWLAEGLTNWHTYEFTLQPLKGWWAAEDDIRSNVVRVVPTPRAPGVAQDVVVTPHHYGAALSWSSAEEATGYRVWSRNLTADGGWETTDEVLTGLEAEVSDLVAGAEYAFRVQATNDGVWGELSEPVNAAPTGPVPAAPSTVGVVPAPTGEVRISWQAVPNATEYRLFRRNVSQGEAWTPVETQVPVTEREFRFVGLRTNERYAFKVQPWNMNVPGIAARPVHTRVPRPAPVRVRRAWSPRRDVVRVSAVPVAGADHYRVFLAPRRACGPRPPALWKYRPRAARYRGPGARLMTRAPALWVRVVGVRDGVVGGRRPSDVRCVRVR